MNETLVVMIPAFNEARTIGRLIKLIPRKIKGIRNVRVLVIDDGSTDDTVKEARKAKADRIVSFHAHKGLGIGFKTGMMNALKMGADIIVNIDADMQFNPKDIPELIKPIQSGEADMVSCTRFARKEFEPEMPLVKKIGNKIVTGIVNFSTGQKFTDTQCGFRAYGREAALRLNLFGRFTYTQEVFLDLVNKGLRIKEVPLRVKGERAYGKSRVVSHWYSYGVKALLIITRSLRDYHPLKFFGSIGLLVFLLGFVPGLALFVRWLATGMTSPYTSLIPVSGALMIIGFLLIVLALVADMLERQRKIQEEILYLARKKEIEN
jgi:glycosyltransferase involved in cell wall biosynthesis